VYVYKFESMQEDENRAKAADSAKANLEFLIIMTF